jgi:hypothetical protein
VKYDKARKLFGGMPPLRHSIPGQPFAWSSSEVAAWLTKQPEAMAYLFGIANYSKAIVFEKESGTWRGCAWKGDA